MRLAADERHPDVDHRETGRHAFLHLGPDALLHGGNILPGNHPAHGLVDKLEPCAALKGLHFDVANRVLAMAAGLLDMASMAGRRCGERFPQRA